MTFYFLKFEPGLVTFEKGLVYISCFDSILAWSDMKQNICESQKRDLITSIDSKRAKLQEVEWLNLLTARGIELENETSCSEVVE